MSDPGGLRIRRAARAIVLDPDDRILLVRFEFAAGTRWALPGGGVDAGESAHDALVRELHEETGLVDPVVGAHVWSRLHVIPFPNGEWDGQRETFHLVRTHTFEPAPLFTTEQLADEYLHEIRWWTLDEIESSPHTFVPAALAHHLAALIAIGAPNVPVDVGV